MDKKILDLIKKGSCVALIPARGGSKSVPKKNIRKVGGYPLLAYSIAAAKLSENIERTIVTTDSEEIAQIARQYGAETPFLRPAEYARDDSPDNEFVEHAIAWLGKNEGSIPQYFVHLRPTTPIRDPELIDDAIDCIRKDDNATSLRSGHLCVHPPYKWFKKEEGRYLSPLMPGMTCDETNLPRQGFADVFVPNGYVDVIRTDFVIETGLLHGERIIGYLTEEIPDIDTELDLKKLEMFDGLQKGRNRLLEHLGRCEKGV